MNHPIANRSNDCREILGGPIRTFANDGSLTSDALGKVEEDKVAWHNTHKDDRPRRVGLKQMPGPWPQNHRGPIRIIPKDALEVESEKKREQERLARLAAAVETGKREDAESSS